MHSKAICDLESFFFLSLHLLKMVCNIASV